MRVRVSNISHLRRSRFIEGDVSTKISLLTELETTMFINGIHFQEYAKLEYGRLLWRNPVYRERLLRH